MPQVPNPNHSPKSKQLSSHGNYRFWRQVDGEAYHAGQIVVHNLAPRGQLQFLEN